MSQSLDQFIVEMREHVDQFEQLYRAKAAANPEQYPLSLPLNNAGVWYEMFMIYMESGGV